MNQIGHLCTRLNEMIDILGGPIGVVSFAAVAWVAIVITAVRR